eukprot:CAMPEP_0175368798 /NCGR_PEP_ID=MMETSP0095-20121207/20365_1 /TAXON_ID=311494 /ORGANISM="Alexandrium monilatum, Strain CCMP3105" /LENGTH=118 /DNA_ID=CAMNT_0016666901 /DNA_START=103 /DNA_END=456 /DNA_ORIENTATION=+
MTSGDCLHAWPRSRNNHVKPERKDKQFRRRARQRPGRQGLEDLRVALRRDPLLPIGALLGTREAARPEGGRGPERPEGRAGAARCGPPVLHGREKLEADPQTRPRQSQAGREDRPQRG